MGRLRLGKVFGFQQDLRVCYLYLISPAFVSFNRAKAKDVVRRFDADGSGSFDRKEVVNCLRFMGLTLNDSEMRSYTKSLFKKLDQDGTNSIGFNEFFEFFQKCLADETDRKKFFLQVQR